MQKNRFIQLVVVVCSIAMTAVSAFAEKPNVVIVITDNQGYGDVAFTGCQLGSILKVTCLCLKTSYDKKSNDDA